MFRKTIIYDRETHDYAMYLDDELIGFARTYHEAEVTLDQLIFELLSGQPGCVGIAAGDAAGGCDAA